MSSSGQIVSFHPGKKHDAKAELHFVAAWDASVVTGGQEMYLISKKWVQQWVSFARGGPSGFNDPIDNSALVDDIHPDRFKGTARFKHDYRLVDKEVWEFYFSNYGGGPVLYIKGAHLDALYV
jgi:hypothetical protein